MVFVAKKKVTLGPFESMKLKIQLMSHVLFVSALAVIIISIFIIFFIQNQIIAQIHEDSRSYVESRMKLEMDNVLLQMKQRLQSTLFYFGQFALELKQITTDSFNTGTPYKALYNDLFAGANPLTQLCTVTTPNFLASSPSFPNDYGFCLGDPTQFTSVTTCMAQGFINTIEQIKSQYFYPDVATNCVSLAIFPNYFIDQSATGKYYYPYGTLYNDQRARAAANTTPRVLIQGPFVVAYSPTIVFPIMSLSLTWKSDVLNKYFHVRIETLLSTFGEFARSSNFRSKNEVVAVSKSGSFVYAPSYWSSKFLLYKIFDVDIQPFSGIDTVLYSQVITNLQQVTVMKKDPDGILTEYLVSTLLLNDEFDPNNKYDTFSSGVDSASQSNYYVIFLYGKKSQMYEVLDNIQILTDKQEIVTRALCLITSFITLAIVFVTTYIVSIRVDKPLRQINSYLKNLNTAPSLKQSLLESIKKKLEELIAVSQYQVQELAIQFRTLIITMMQRNESGNTNSKKLKIEYPLNELEQNFVKKTKGSQSQFDWEKLIEFIPNMSKFPDNSKKNP